MEQDQIEKPGQLLHELLSNPLNASEAAAGYLEQLLKSEPQSGLLQAIYACSVDREKLKSTALYFNSAALYKMVHAPDALLEPGLPQFVNFIFPEPVEEPAGMDGEFAEGAEHPDETYATGEEAGLATEEPEESPVQHEAAEEPAALITELQPEETAGELPVLEPEEAEPLAFVDDEEEPALPEPTIDSVDEMFAEPVGAFELTENQETDPETEVIQQPVEEKEEAIVAEEEPVALQADPEPSAETNIIPAEPQLKESSEAEAPQEASLIAAVPAEDDEVYEEIVGIEDINFAAVNQPFTAAELTAIAAGAAEEPKAAEAPDTEHKPAADPIVTAKPSKEAEQQESLLPEEEFGFENVGEETEIYIDPLYDESVFIPEEPGTLEEILYATDEPVGEGFEIEEEQATEKSQIPPIPEAAVSSVKFEAPAQPAIQEATATADENAAKEPLYAEEGRAGEPATEEETEQSVTEEPASSAEPEITEFTAQPETVEEPPVATEPEPAESTEQSDTEEQVTIPEPLADEAAEDEKEIEPLHSSEAKEEPESAELTSTEELPAIEHEPVKGADLTKEPVQEQPASEEIPATPEEEQTSFIAEAGHATEGPQELTATEETEPESTLLLQPIVNEPVTLPEAEEQSAKEETPETLPGAEEETAEEDLAVISEELTGQEAAPVAVEEPFVAAQEEEPEVTEAGEPASEEAKSASADTPGKQKVAVEEIGESAFAYQDEPFTETQPETVYDEEPEQLPMAVNEAAARENETEKLIIESIAAADYFVFDQTFGIHSWPEKADEPPAQEKYGDPAPAKQEEPAYVPAPEPKAAPVEEQEEVADGDRIVVRYNDDKLPYSFMWWLDKTRREHAGVYQPYSKPAAVPNPAEVQLQPVAPPAAPQAPATPVYARPYQLEPAPPVTPEPEAGTRKKEDKLIERFIQEEPHMKPPSSDKLKTENKARKSAEDHDEIITETLARIYTDQMLFDKAITTYQKLMLKYPQKSSYFASLIEELEKRIS